MRDSGGNIYPLPPPLPGYPHLLLLLLLACETSSWSTCSQSLSYSTRYAFLSGFCMGMVDGVWGFKHMPSLAPTADCVRPLVIAPLHAYPRLENAGETDAHKLRGGDRSNEGEKKKKGRVWGVPANCQPCSVRAAEQAAGWGQGGSAGFLRRRGGGGSRAGKSGRCHQPIRTRTALATSRVAPVSTSSRLNQLTCGYLGPFNPPYPRGVIFRDAAQLTVHVKTPAGC